MSPAPEGRGAFTLLEVLVVVLLLSIVLIPVIHLVVQQRREMSWASMGSVLHDHAVSRLLDQEAGLIVSGFPTEPRSTSRVVKLEVAGGELSVDEAVTVAPSRDVRGLYRVDVELSWTDLAIGEQRRQLRLSRLMVDRVGCTGVPAGSGPP